MACNEHYDCRECSADQDKLLTAKDVEIADLKVQIAGARLEEARWWADGHHGAIIKARFHGACPKCERITDLEKRATVAARSRS